MFGAIISKLKLIFIPCKENNYRPQFLEGRFLPYYVIVLLILRLITIPAFFFFQKNIFFADITKTILIELTNKERELFGLHPLKENPQLNTAAYLKAEDMMENDYFSHQSPEGLLPWHWFKKAGYNYKFAGENLAIGFLDSEEVNRAWLESFSHKENILNSNYEEIGIAVVQGDFQGNETALVVQLFGAPQTTFTTQETQEETIATVKPQKEISPEQITKEEKERVVSEKTSIFEEPISSAKDDSIQDALTFNFFRFISLKYNDLIQKITYVSLIFVIFSLFTAVFCDIFIYKRFSIQYKDFVLKTIGFCLILAIFLIIDKEAIIRFIPHNFRIY